MEIPRASDGSKQFFRSLIETDDPRVFSRRMFGNLAAFVNGNMYCGLFGDGIFLRLSDKERDNLMKEMGSSAFEPMAGRPMRGYYMIPKAWMGKQGVVKQWISRALEYTEKLPPKESGRSKKSSKKEAPKRNTVKKKKKD